MFSDPRYELLKVVRAGFASQHLCLEGFLKEARLAKSTREHTRRALKNARHER
jgi:hypothetical protein